MSWYFWAFICSLMYGIEGVYLKFLHKKNIDEFSVLKALFLYSIPFLFPVALNDGFYFKKKLFFLFLLIVGIGNSLGFYFYSKSIKNTDVSIAVPILSVSPILVIPTSYIIMGEILPFKGIIGVVITTIGLFLLSYSKKNRINFFQDKGVIYAFITVLIWSVVASLDKRALKLSSPSSYPFFSVTMITLILIFSTPGKEIFNRKYIFYFLIAGFIHALLFLSHMFALNSSFVAYLIAIKRSGMIVSVLLGWILFKEKKPFLKLLSSIIILGGIYLLLS